MKVLMHYTTQRIVYDCFSNKGTFDFTKNERVGQVSDFYKRYNRTQNHLFFVVSFCNLENGKIKYTACNINYNENDDKYEFTSVSDRICKIICGELGLEDSNTYDSDTFYRVFTIEDDEKIFINNNHESDLNKLRMKFFSWDELISAKEILFNEICDNIFNIENVLKVASTYKPNIKYSEKQKKKKYFEALKTIGFISDKGVDIFYKTLHGDIGEFLMHIMLGMFLREQSIEKYIYPKLVFKTSPKMPVYGNDGTIYIKDKKEIYYLEAKFYSDLNSAINKAVESLIEHNEVSNESFSHRIELFRNVKTDELDEIIEIDEEVTENLVLFLMCDDYTNYDDILHVIRKNSKLKSLKIDFNIVLFVLPILSKEEYLKYFQSRGSEVWEELNA
ncbi:MAG: DUF1837 domain-containing protein [Firmicutes bacterium]|nr:DUF1837 domain-containing protein [Bacillota bacterium]